MIVLLGHGVLPMINENLAKSNILLHYLDLLIKLLQPNGVAAVMGFFIISGFVIHYPFANGKVINVPEFYCRRILRVAIPAIIAFCIYHFGFKLYMGVVWSLICEVIYYLLYPIILKFKKNLKTILILSFVVSYFLTLSYRYFYGHDDNGDIHRNGYFLTWMVGLPVWLLGVLLADQYHAIIEKSVKPTYLNLWVWRVFMWGLSSVCLMLRFHYSIPYGFTMPIFSIFAFYWIRREIIYYELKNENYILAFGGVISYSIYLVHAVIIHLGQLYFKANELKTNALACIIIIILSLIASYLYYNIVEKPSHNLARSIKV